MAPVQLYVYDLSNGMARSMSFQLTGKQIDGIWHTSVVVFGKEIYYGPYNAGPGIQVTSPGRSHHGSPLKVENMGETALDEETFFEYISEVQQHYTGERYHLLDFNCNSFTNDCVGFLTGGSIPSWIKDLPADFLSTPFGASMRPMIDNMYRRPGAGPVPAQTTVPPLASSSIASSITSPVQVSTNQSSFASLLKSHKAAVAFFTSDTCPPCKMIAPVFKDLAANKASNNVAFVEVNSSVGMSGMIAREYSISATPTFLFFLDGKKTSELKGVNAPELKSQVDFLLFEAFPPHPHVKLDLPTIRSISLQPILYSQVPPLDSAHAKLLSFVSEAPSLDKAVIKATLSDLVLPFLKSRFIEQPQGKAPATVPLPPRLLPAWSKATNQLLQTLPIAQLFPLIDFWRLAILDERVASWIALAGTRNDESDITQKIFSVIANIQRDGGEVPRNVLLTALRLAANCFAFASALGRHILSPAGNGTSPRQALTLLLISALLHKDSQTRTAAASLAFNISAFVQKPLMDQQRRGDREGTGVAEGEGDWEVEVVSALTEALGRESESEEVVHRLAASLSFFVHLSPFYTDSLAPLLDVLQVKDVLRSKLTAGGCGPKGVQKPEVKKLVQEVVLLCS